MSRAGARARGPLYPQPRASPMPLRPLIPPAPTHPPPSDGRDRGLAASPLERLLRPLTPLPSCTHTQAHTNVPVPARPQMGETEDSLPPLERLLRCAHEGAHLAIADALWEAPSDADACAALGRLAAEALPGWEEELRAGRGGAEGGSGAGRAGSAEEERG